MNRSFSASRHGRALGFVLLLLLLAGLPAVSLAQGEDPLAAPTDGLTPGRHVTYTQKVPVNLVFVGYEPGDFALNDLRGILPASYEPQVRYPLFYGLPGRDMGLRFNFAYDVVYAPQRFEDDFFAYQASIAVPGPMTPGMAYYNNQQNNVLDITDPVWYIDAPSTEAWLMNNAGRLGVDTNKGYTVFFLNSYNRPDFNFHLYTKTGFADPDLGYDHGANDWYRTTVAWGGSHGRTWFHDLSAGPEDWSFTENVDNPDVTGDGVEDYRMPPIWEYSPNGFHDRAVLGRDLGLLTRYVAINLLFTPSPLYDPLASSPEPEGQKVVHNEIFELDGVRGVDGTAYYDVGYTLDRLAALQPYYDWDGAVDLNKPPDAGAKRALRIFSGNALLRGCWEAYGATFAELFCHFNQNYDRYVPAYDEADYVIPVFSYNITDKMLGSQSGLLGFADDNWVDGTPSYMFLFSTPLYRLLGFGLSAPTVHEVGHHIGLSHPHDGYDWEQGLDYGASGPTFFAWQGDFSATTMSYMWNNDGFGVFNHDNMDRYQFAGYLNWANELLAGIVAHPDAATVRPLVNQADALASQAQRAFNRWEYAPAAANARGAYELIVTAAAQLGLPSDVATPQFLPTDRPVKEGDWLKGPFVD